MRRVGTVLGSMEFGRGQCVGTVPQVRVYVEPTNSPLFPSLNVCINIYVYCVCLSM